MGPTLLLITNRKFHIRAFIRSQNQRPWMTLNGRTTLYCKMMRLSGLTTEIWKKMDLYAVSVAKCSPGTLVYLYFTFFQSVRKWLLFVAVVVCCMYSDECDDCRRRWHSRWRRWNLPPLSIRRVSSGIFPLFGGEAGNLSCEFWRNVSDCLQIKNEHVVI